MRITVCVRTFFGFASRRNRPRRTHVARSPAFLVPNGRPRIVYQVTQRGKDLLDLLERVVKEYTVAFKSDFARELESLEAKLAAGEIAEEMYFKRRKELETRYELAL